MTFEEWFNGYAPTAPEALDDCAKAAWDAATLAAVSAERERWTARVEEAFRDGFYAPRTYNDIVLNTAEGAWEEAKDEYT
jgi:hypothetical protein